MTAAKDKEKQPGAGASAEAVERMNVPIDVEAEYRISGQVIAQLYTQIDEVPMKYARTILPLIGMNIERILPED